MHTYAILCNPGHNRVYFETSLKLAVSEFLIASRRMSVLPRDTAQKSIAGIDYFAFSAGPELSPEDIEILSGLSFVYALFEIIDLNGATHLIPVARTNRRFVDESISSILKYTGKTNELFTRLMINVAMYTREGAGNELNLLDPVAGKGTTLFEGLIKGFDVYGFEVGEKAVNEVFHFVKKFLETEKYS